MLNRSPPLAPADVELNVHLFCQRESADPTLCCTPAGITGWICDDRPDRGAAQLAALLPLIPGRATPPVVQICWPRLTDAVAAQALDVRHLKLPALLSMPHSLPSLLLPLAADRLLIETDCPYLTPRTIKPSKTRPQRCEPALLPHVLAAVAAARGEPVEHTAAITTANARRLFRLDDM